jgi:hypothetical protein
MKMAWLTNGFFTSFISSACLIASLASCSNGDVSQPVSVTAAPLAVHTSHFKDSKSKDFRSLDESLLKDPNFDAFTIWFYHCFADFQTQDEHVDDTAGASSVRLKIKAVQIRLSCPITIWLAKDSPALVSEHEKGHVYICSKVYGRAPKVARDAALLVVGKSYNGMGNNVAAARRMAIAQAEGDIAQIFREEIVALADEISTAYDALCSDDLAVNSGKSSKKTQQSLADLAYQQVIERVVKFL